MLRETQNYQIMRCAQFFSCSRETIGWLQMVFVQINGLLKPETLAQSVSAWTHKNLSPEM